MPVSDLEIRMTANALVRDHGDAALTKAREMVEEMRRKGDEEGADTWLRVIVAIADLGTPPTDARH